VVTYDIPQGERRGIDVDLTDATYDGIVDGQRLSGGLGQLTDGELGQSNFRAVDRRGTSIKASSVSSLGPSDDLATPTTMANDRQPL